MVLYKSPKIAILWVVWCCLWCLLHGPSSYYVGPYMCSSTRIVTKSSSKPIPGLAKGFSKKRNFEKIANDTRQSKYFCGFCGAYGAGYMGLRLHGPTGHYVGPHGFSSMRIVTKSSLRGRIARCARAVRALCTKVGVPMARGTWGSSYYVGPYGC